MPKQLGSELQKMRFDSGEAATSRERDYGFESLPGGIFLVLLVNLDGKNGVRPAKLRAPVRPLPLWSELSSPSPESYLPWAATCAEGCMSHVVRRPLHRILATYKKHW